MDLLDLPDDLEKSILVEGNRQLEGVPLGSYCGIDSSAVDGTPLGSSRSDLISL